MKVVSSRLVAIFWSTYRQHRRPGRGPWPSALVVVLQCRSGLLLKPDKNVSRVVGLGEGQDRKGCPYMRRVANPPSTSVSKLLWALPCNAGPLQSCPTSWWSIQHIRSVADHLRNIPLQEEFIKRRLNIFLHRYKLHMAWCIYTSASVAPLLFTPVKPYRVTIVDDVVALLTWNGVTALEPSKLWYWSVMKPMSQSISHTHLLRSDTHMLLIAHSGAGHGQCCCSTKGHEPLRFRFIMTSLFLQQQGYPE